MIWLVVVISLYYVWHKPVTPVLALRIAIAVGRLFVVFVLISLAGALGRRLFRLDGLSLTNMALQASLGIGVLSLLILLMGATLGVNRLLAWLLVLILSLLLWRDGITWWRSLWAVKPLWELSNSLGKWLASGLAIILLATLSTTLAPPIKYDALVYHLAIPQFYLQSGEILYNPQLMYWGMPQVGEMLYTWAAALAGLEAAAVLGWALGLLALAGLAGFLLEKWGASAAWVGIAALTAGTTFSASLAWAYTDWLLLLFGLSMLIVLDKWVNNEASRNLILAGSFAGLALGCKYTGGVAALAGCAVILWESWRKRKKPARILRDLSVFILPMIGLSLPWWIKNALATGNPFYPFFIPGGAMDSFRLAFYHIQPWGDWRDVLLLPVMASITGVEGAPGYNASIGPLLLGLGLFSLIKIRESNEKERAALRIAIIAGLSALAIWGIVARWSGYLIQSRLYAAAFPAFAALAAAGYRSVNQMRMASVRLGRLAGALILVVYAFSAIEVVRLTVAQGAAQVFWGIKTEEQYREDNLGWYAHAMQAILDLPQGARVVMLWEPRSLYCMPRCAPDEVIDRWKHSLTLVDSPEDVLEKWRSEGYTHLLVHNAGADFVRVDDPRYQNSDWEALDLVLGSLPSPVDFGQAYSLYALRP